MRLPFSANSRHTQPQVATVKLHVFLHGKDIYKGHPQGQMWTLCTKNIELYCSSSGNQSLKTDGPLLLAVLGRRRHQGRTAMLVSHQLWNNNVAEPDHRCSMYWWPVGHYLQGAGQAWSGQPGILIQGISYFQVQPIVLSLQELVGCHYGQWSTLSQSRASSGAVETASSHMQQQEQSLQDDHFCMGRAAPNLDGYRPKGGSQMQATGMYGEMQIASDLKQP